MDPFALIQIHMDPTQNETNTNMICLESCLGVFWGLEGSKGYVNRKCSWGRM